MEEGRWLTNGIRAERKESKLIWWINYKLAEQEWNPWNDSFLIIFHFPNRTRCFFLSHGFNNETGTVTATQPFNSYPNNWVYHSDQIDNIIRSVLYLRASVVPPLRLCCSVCLLTEAAAAAAEIDRSHNLPTIIHTTFTANSFPFLSILPFLLQSSPPLTPLPPPRRLWFNYY